MKRIEAVANICLLALILNVQPCLAETVPGIPSPTASAPEAGGIVDDSVPGWIWSGMVEVDDSVFHGGAAHAGGSGSNCAYTFKGTAIEIIGMKGQSISVDGHGHKLGSADVLLDGKSVGSIDEKASSEEVGTVLKEISGLSDSNHVLQLKATAGWFVVDYLKTVAGDSADGTRHHPKIASFIPEGEYRIVPVNSTSECLCVTDNSVQDGAKLEINMQTQGDDRMWYVEPLGHEHYRITPSAARNENLCIPAPENNGPGLPAFMWHDAGDPRQQVDIVTLNDGMVSICLATNPNIVLDVDHGDQGATQPGTHVICYNWHGGINQKWWLVPATK